MYIVLKSIIVMIICYIVHGHVRRDLAIACIHKQICYNNNNNSNNNNTNC